MKGRTQILIGVGIWMVSLAFVLGALVLSLVEGGFRQPSAPSTGTVVTVGEETETIAAPEEEHTPTPTLTHTAPPTPTATPTFTHSPTLTQTSLPSATATPSATEKKRKQNPTSTEASAKCGPPAGWVVYVVRKGDTLYSISQRTGASVAALQIANCMGNSTAVRAGQNLYVPRLPKPIQPTATKKPLATKKPPKTIIPPESPIPVTPNPTESSYNLSSPQPVFAIFRAGQEFAKSSPTGIVLAIIFLRCL